MNRGGMAGKDEIKTFEDLECWQACRELRRVGAEACKSLPREEGYRLKDQILRAGRGATATIAEGYGRFHYQETIQYCRTARGSIYEVLDHFITGNDEGFFSDEKLLEVRGLVKTAVKLTNGYIRYLKSRQQNGSG